MPVFRLEVYDLRASRTSLKKIFSKIENKLALFANALRVRRCGLFFARFVGVNVLGIRIWELCGGDFVDNN